MSVICICNLHAHFLKIRITSGRAFDVAGKGTPNAHRRVGDGRRPCAALGPRFAAAHDFHADRQLHAELRRLVGGIAGGWHVAAVWRLEGLLDQLRIQAAAEGDGCRGHRICGEPPPARGRLMRTISFCQEPVVVEQIPPVCRVAAVGHACSECAIFRRRQYGWASIKHGLSDQLQLRRARKV